MVTTKRCFSAFVFDWELVTFNLDLEGVNIILTNKYQPREKMGGSRNSYLNCYKLVIFLQLTFKHNPPPVRPSRCRPDDTQKLPTKVVISFSV